MKAIDLDVQGMTCAGCVSHVRKALLPLDGVDDVAVDLQAGHVRVGGALDAGVHPLITALDDAGYPAKVSGAAAPVLATPSATSTRGGCCGG